jgi:hypothetical protein
MEETMGRPPKSLIAMTGAERSRRYRRSEAEHYGILEMENEYYRHGFGELLKMLARAGVTPADVVARLKRKAQAQRSPIDEGEADYEWLWNQVESIASEAGLMKDKERRG